MEKAIRLFDLNQFIKRVIGLNFPDRLWVTAEILQVSQKRGHTYVTLIENEVESDEIIAQSNAVLWSTDYLKIKKKIEDLDSYFIGGNQVMLLVMPVFHEKFGYQLVIEDIDTAFTRGELDRKKEILFNKVKAEGLDLINKKLPIPLIFSRIAIVSSLQAAGLEDFKKTLSDNSHLLQFDLTIFESAMQGQLLDKEVLAAIQAINNSEKLFDCIVIIRGGGSKVDLSGFDSYPIAEAISRSKYPVFTGIGHEIDFTLSDLVASKNFKTPTAVAEYLIQTNYNIYLNINTLIDDIKVKISQKIDIQSVVISQLSLKIFAQMSLLIESGQNELNLLNYKINTKLISVLNRLQSAVNQVYDSITLQNPKEILNKGYVLLYQNDVQIKSKNDLNNEESLTVVFKDGKIIIK